MDFSEFLEPLDVRFEEIGNSKSSFGNIITKYTRKENFPAIEGYQIAIIGVGEDRGAVRNDGCGRAPILSARNFTS